MRNGTIDRRSVLQILAATAATGASVYSGRALAAASVDLSDAQVEEIVRRSIQYVAMFNVIQKFALVAPGEGEPVGFNNPNVETKLLDHTVQSIARPNNDTLYQQTLLDLRDDAVIVEYPAIDSEFVALETAGYAHYCEMPLLSANDDFEKSTKMLFYTDRTKGYDGEAVEGVDEIFEADGDFYFAFLRAMPHQSDPERMAKVTEALQNVKLTTLSEFQGKPAVPVSQRDFPAYGATDVDIFSGNLLEVMQFVFNHTTFDPDNEMDQAVLALYAPLGVVPGKAYDPADVAQLDGAQFGRVAGQVYQEGLAAMVDPEVRARITDQMFMPKGKIDLETQVVQSVAGPIGVPSYVARYLPARAEGGETMNAQHDYVMRMSADELPPAQAFWSLTLYDLENGFFIPNDQKKYSVGENAGFELDENGGIEIYVSATKPEGVPEENWLPINREDVDLDPMFRIYEPDPENMKEWTIPEFEKLSA